MLNNTCPILPLTPLGQTPPTVLTIAGSDSGGGAGIQADLRTFALLGVHSLVAVTAVTAQNTLGVEDICTIPAPFVRQQIHTVHTDIGIGAAKTGMLAHAEIIYQIAQYWKEHAAHIPLVVDPVCASMHGNPLLAVEALDTLRHELIPLATLVTPNLDEVALITGITSHDPTALNEAGQYFLELGAQAVLLKGGHNTGTESTDYLYTSRQRTEFTSPRYHNNGNDHGGGDTLAAAITAALAHGYPLDSAVAFAKEWVSNCIQAAYSLGAGHGPVNAMWRLHTQP